MYSEKDFADIRRRIVRGRMALAPVLIALAALVVVGLSRRVSFLAYGGAALLAAALVFGFAFYLLPCHRYLAFLNDLQKGLSRQMTGTVVSISDTPQPQDGARVLPVRLLLKDEQDERIIYLNASKRDRFPGPGAQVHVTLCGRHILQVETAIE